MKREPVLLCRCSLADSHLSQSRVGDDHRVNKGPAAAHLPHLLRHARRHGRLLCLPDQVSQGFRSHLCVLYTLLPLLLSLFSAFPFYCSNPLCLTQARCNFGFPFPEQTEESNILDVVIGPAVHPL